MNKIKQKLILEEYSGDFRFKKINRDININFNRVAFIYFVFIIIFIIFALKLTYLGNKTFVIKNNLKFTSDFRSTILDRNNVIIAKSVITKNIGINPKQVIDKQKLLLNLKLIFPDKDYNLISSKLYKGKFFICKRKYIKKFINNFFS